MDVRVGPERRMNVEELMLLNCGIREDSWNFLDCKEIKPVNSKGNQSWTFTGRTDAEAETPILWPDVKNWFLGKDPDAGKDWRQKKRGRTEDEMVGWHHWLDGHEFEQAPGDSEGQGGLACCSPWGRKESDMTERLNWTDWPSIRKSSEKCLLIVFAYFLIWFTFWYWAVWVVCILED